MEEASPVKKQKLQIHCMIHCTDDKSRFISPTTLESWNTLKNAGVVRKHPGILEIMKDTLDGEIPQIFYHRQCRSVFTLKRNIDRIINEQSAEETNTEPRKSIRQIPVVVSSVLEKKCIFCEKQDKYIKGSRTKAALIQAKELRVDETVRKVAERKCDNKLLAILSREIVAAEAHYHRACYRSYTKPPKDNNSHQEEDLQEAAYEKAEAKALAQLFNLIRNDIFEDQCAVHELSKLTEKVLTWMREDGISNIKTSTKKHIRRKLSAEFGNSLHMVLNPSNKLLVYSDVISIDQLVIQNHQLKSEIKALQSAQENHNVAQSALQLRLAVKEQTNGEIKWPPNVAELDKEHVSIPALLTDFLRTLLTGNETEASQRVEWQIMSVAQDLLFGITKGRYKPAKHILLPSAVKSLSGNVEIIQLLNRLGHGISYSQLEEIDTSLCLQKLAMKPKDGISLPKSIIPHEDTTLAFDNIDRLEATLSGSGTSHRVNGISVQAVTFGPQLPDNPIPHVAKDKQRTIEVADDPIAVYNAGQRANPALRTFIEIDPIPLIEEVCMKDLLHIIARLHDTDRQQVSSWTGFNIQVHDKEDVVPSKIAYLPTINAPATSLTTVNEILNQALTIRNQLHLPAIVCVFDQAIYAKAAEIKWKHSQVFAPIVLRLGTFHTICTMLSIIGKRFQDAGLRDICIESSVIAEGSVSSVLGGKSYNRAIRLHKLTLEAFMRMAWDGFLPWVDKNHSANKSTVEEVVSEVADFVSDINKENHDHLLQLPSFQVLSTLFQQYINFLRVENGDLSSFWVSYMDMVQVVLAMVRASREGNWDLHLAAVRQMLPWCFAYNAHNYARYMSVYYSDMTSLPDEHPSVFDYMKAGGFSVQMNVNNPFGRVPVDQTLEETINKDTQTPGGTKGFSLKPGALQRYYLTAEYRSLFLHNLREMVGYGSGKTCHSDLQPSRIATDEAAIKSIIDLISGNWTNPFGGGAVLVSLSTGALAPDDVANDLKKAYQVGEDAYNEFKEERLQSDTSTIPFFARLPRMKLKTFSNLQKTKTVGKAHGAVAVLRADRNLFAHMIIMAQSRQLQMQDVLKHPLGPLPWSLASNDGLLRKTNKAQLAREIKKLAQPCDQLPKPSVCIIDGMAIVQTLKVDHTTFGEIAEVMFARVIREGENSRRIDVVFDVYNEQSIKNTERIQRGEGTAIQFRNLAAGHKVKQFRNFLKDGSNKNSLIKFFVDSWVEEKCRTKLTGKVMYVTCGSRCLRLTKEDVDEVEELASNQEEADTRLLLHAAHAAKYNYESLVFTCEDTDVFILCLAHSHLIRVPMIQKSTTQSRTTFTDITKLSIVLGQDVCKALPGMHSFTGCDTVSAFAGKGKLKPLKMLQSSNEYQSMFQALGESWTLSTELFAQLEKFTCEMYGSSKNCDINQQRFDLFCAKKGEIESHQLPPCQDCLQKHCIRANYQAAVWRNSIKNNEIPSPIGKGWSMDNGQIEIDWMAGLPAPETVIQLLSCTCKRSCNVEKCPCMQNGLKCTDMCALSTCTNQAVDEIMDDIGNEETDSEDEM